MGKRNKKAETEAVKVKLIVQGGMTYKGAKHTQGDEFTVSANFYNAHAHRFVKLENGNGAQFITSTPVGAVNAPKPEQVEVANPAAEEPKVEPEQQRLVEKEAE